MELAIGLGQRGSTRREVVEHECPFIHLGQKPGSDESLRNHSGDDQNSARDQYPPPVMQHPLERLLVAN